MSVPARFPECVFLLDDRIERHLADSLAAASCDTIRIKQALDIPSLRKEVGCSKDSYCFFHASGSSEAATLTLCQLQRALPEAHHIAILETSQSDALESLLRAGAHYCIDSEELPSLSLERILRTANYNRKCRQQLQTALCQAESHNSAKSSYLAMISHELRTPLNGIMGFSQMLLEGELDEGQRECVDMIRKSGHHLLAVVSDILDISLLEQGHMGICQASFLLHDILEEIAAFFQPLIADKGLEFQFQMPDPAHIPVRGDAQRIRQIFYNLLGNALKFTDAGSIRVFSQASRSIDGQFWQLDFRITDTGCGIPLDKQTALFRPFQVALPLEGRKEPGSGLGLALCKCLCELMQGSIYLQSTPAKGSTLYFRIRLSADTDSEQLFQDNCLKSPAARAMKTGSE